MTRSTAGTRTRLWIGAALAPVVSGVLAALLGLGPDVWRWSGLRTVTADAFLITSGALVLLAPLAGVAVGSASLQETRDRRLVVSMAVTLGVAALILSASSAGLAALASGPSVGAIESLTPSHVTLASVAFALGVFGACCGSTLRDPLDAAAVSLAVVVFAAGGLLVAGAPVAEAPRQLLQAGLMASPFVAVASAAGIDVVRLDAIYQISPLAHMRVDYPSWQAACASYFGVAAVLVAGLLYAKGSGSTTRQP